MRCVLQGVFMFDFNRYFKWISAFSKESLSTMANSVFPNLRIDTQGQTLMAIKAPQGKIASRLIHHP